MTRAVEADYFVVGAGALGMAFADALTDHADVRVALVDRRHGVGGHWLEAYPLRPPAPGLRLLRGRIDPARRWQLQQSGPEVGLQERATQAEILAYYLRMLDRMVESGGRVPPQLRVRRRPPRRLADLRRASRGAERCRVVDARYLSPSIPAEKPPPFAVADDAGAAGQRPGTARGGARASTSSSGRARRRPTRASGCSRVVSIPIGSAGCDRAIRGC